MKKNKVLRLSTLNRIILTTLIAVLIIFSLLITLVTNILLSSSIKTAKAMYNSHADHIIQVVKDNMNFMSGMLNFTQQSLGMLDFKSGEVDTAADRILIAMMNLSPNVYCSWFGLEKGVRISDKRYTKSFIRQDGVITEITRPEDLETLDNPDIAPQYAVPLLTGNAYFNNVGLYDYGAGEGPVYTATVSVPIFDNGVIIGVCGVDFQYQEVFDQISLHEAEAGMNVMLLSGEMTILYAADEQYVRKNMSDFGFNDFTGILNATKDMKIFTDEMVSPVTGVKSLVSFIPLMIDTGIGRHPMYLYFDMPLHSLYANAYNITIIIVISSIICMMIIVGIIFINTDNFIRPIRKLTHDAQQISIGNFDVDFSSIDPEDSASNRNEIATLQRALMKMVSMLKENLITMERRVEKRTHQLMLITEEAEAAKKRAEEAAEAKSLFLANMSHEIRTPMNAILGMTELLLSETLSKHQHRCVDDIKISAMALLNIINDILDLSKIQAGKLSLIPVHYDFASLVDNIGSMARFLIKDKNIVYKFVVLNEIPKCLYGDDVRLRQILINVLSNAIKFTDEGYVRLTIGVMDTNIRFDVEDTGIGIRQEDLPMLFDAFAQADTRKNVKKKGTGLGLSITKTLVEMMGGKITVESVYSRGTIFHIIIPKVLGDEAKIPKPETEEKIIYAPDAKILVVDDNSVNLNVSSGLLQLCKITADTASSGKQAIDMIQQKKYDLIFMDHMMPEMDGVEATTAIRGLGFTVPIVALTANAVEGTEAMFLAAGMNDLLTKPINKTELKSMLEKWIPGEKIIRPLSDTVVHDAAETDQQKEFWRKIESIDDLSVHAGLDRVSDQRDVYEKSLRLTIKEIEKCDKNLKEFLDKKDMHNFSIEVHSMKGSLANIGAMELSAHAKDLEMAADKSDVEFCSANITQFLFGLNGFKEKLKEAFNEIEEDTGPLEIPEELHHVFNSLIDALDRMDFSVIDSVVDDLNSVQLHGAVKKEIEDIKDSIMMMDYENATIKMRALLTNGAGAEAVQART
ncbi:MAG: ATP-binding protein [Treponema sp.]|nr:ATP-binding protein [Treponema sp.]